MNNSAFKDFPGLTVIIPAYNVQSYIAECLKSVLDQSCTRDNIYVIVVIDGATDDTLLVAEKTIRKYDFKNIEIIQQSNQGMSSARNNGLKKAKTEYVAFLDSDDFWLPGYLDTVLPALSSFRPDILEYDAIYSNSAGKPLSTLKISGGPTNQKSKVDLPSFLKVFRCYIWARIYRNTLFQKHQFPAGRRYEDTLSMPWLYWDSQNIISLGTPLISYRQREGSVVRSPTIADVADLNFGVQSALAMWREQKDEYWLHVAMRIHQQACTRSVELPFRSWASAIKLAPFDRKALNSSKLGLMRKLQVNHTLLYGVLLHIKHNTIDILSTLKARRRLAIRKNGTAT